MFEAVRAAVFDRVQDDLRRGAVFYDLHRSDPARLDVFSAAIADGRGHVLNRRLFIVQTDLEGALTVHQPTLLLEFTPAPTGTEPPMLDGLPGLDQVEQALADEALFAFLNDVTAQREHETDTIWRHMDLSLNELINRQNIRMGELLTLQAAGDTSQPLAANIAITQERLDELNARLERRRQELEQERFCTITDVQHHGRAWVLPHPERSSPDMAPMVRDDEIERIAVDAAIAYEEARGWRVQSVERDNRGFDLISRKPHPNDPQTSIAVRFIEVKGRAEEGLVALSSHEHDTAVRLKDDYWLYVVYNCARAPEVVTIQNPALIDWQPVHVIEHFRATSDQIRGAATRE